MLGGITIGKVDKKQRHRVKREAKRREVRRRESISPLKRLADAPGEVECWMSENFESIRQAQIFAYKRGAGLTGVACFLIDRGVVGLKDSWHRIGLERSEFQRMIDMGNRKDLPMKRVTLDEARWMITGGARWAHDNGMRLPKEWLKTITLIGGVGDWASADVSGFVMEFVGHPEDLRQRLIGEPFDTYLERTDVRFVFSADAPFMDQETGQYFDGNDVDEEDDDGDSNDDEEPTNP